MPPYVSMLIILSIGRDGRIMVVQQPTVPSCSFSFNKQINVELQFPRSHLD